jgi:hypothetical protein
MQTAAQTVTMRPRHAPTRKLGPAAAVIPPSPVAYHEAIPEAPCGEEPAEGSGVGAPAGSTIPDQGSVRFR